VPPARPAAGVDGVMILFTLQQDTRTALVIFAPVDGDHFPDERSPRANVSFKDSVPQGDALKNLISSLTPNQPVNGIALAVLTPPPDVFADKRIGAVIDALVAAGRPGAGVRTGIGKLGDGDRDKLLALGITLDGLDEVIFLEPQQ
jgi:hypothetical protein